MSEWILNGTSAQLGYIQCHSRWKIQNRRRIKNTANTQTKDNPEKQTTQNTAEQNYPGLVTAYNTWPGNEVGLFYTVSQKNM